MSTISVREFSCNPSAVFATAAPPAGRLRTLDALHVASAFPCGRT
ncbi:hypothetical protein [Streptomyces sp. NPDC014676]